jgi:hypothetical protein
MSFWSKLFGTYSDTFQIGKGGPKVKRLVAALEARNAGDTDYAVLRCAEAAAQYDACNLGMTDAAATPDTIAMRDSNGDVIVPLTPTAAAGAASKSYAESLVTSPGSFELQVFAPGTPVATGDGKMYCRAPFAFTLDDVGCAVITAGTSVAGGLLKVQVHNVTQAHDVLSTVLTVDSAETDSTTAATAAVISQPTIAEGDMLRVDVDEIHDDVAPQGLIVSLVPVGGGSGSNKVSGDWELIESITIAGAAETEKDFSTVLSDAAYSGYKITANIANGYAGAAYYYLRYTRAGPVTENCVGTMQYITASSTAVSGARALAAPAPFGAAFQNQYVAPEATIENSAANIGSRYMLARAGYGETTGTTVIDYVYHFTTPAQGTEIIGLGVYASQANGIGIGSILRLYGRIA